MSFKSFLSAVGNDVKKVFGWLGSAAGQATIAGAEAGATVIATAINPAAGAALSGIESLVNSGLKSVIATESLAAAAGVQSGSGPQKLAAVTEAIAPNAAGFLQSIGVSNPTSAEVQTVTTAIANGLVAILNALPAPTAAAA